MTDHEFQLLTILLDKGLLALLAVLCAFWLKKWQEDRVATIQRQFVPRIEFELCCEFFGPQAGEYLVHLSIKASNKGTMRRKFKSILIRLRGIEAGAPLSYRPSAGDGPLEFPKRLLKDDLVPSHADGEYYYYYVEPQVSQVFTYVTKIPANIRYVLAHVKFVPITEDQEETSENEFTEERLFLVRSKEEDVRISRYHDPSLEPEAR